MKHLTHLKRLFEEYNTPFPTPTELSIINQPTLSTLLSDTTHNHTPHKSSFHTISTILKEIKTEIKLAENTTNIRTALAVHYSSLIKSHIFKTQKAILTLHSSTLSFYRKISGLCVREAKRAFSRTSRVNPLLKGKKLTKEISLYHRKTDKTEKDSKKKIEKEQIERKKKDFEQKESERQSRKLNFLLTQTELFSHFIMHKKKEGFVYEKGDTEVLKEADGLDSKQQDVIDSTDIQTPVTDIPVIDTKSLADKEIARTQEYGSISKKSLYTSIQQPNILTCKLKDYQLKGLNWLANLYDQGINGILADDMGLGKTVQAISFLAYLNETENITGPFLIVTPASTLHNWLQEFEKFLPSFKIIPYWGSILERKALRKNWYKNSIGITPGSIKDSSRGVNDSTLNQHPTTLNTFNCVVTSYQIIVTDEKYFNKVKWNYMILDEAQAIKSSTSLRWKVLLNIKCRNRLLLTGTPIQNSMQELWALLHFIMPTLFDSHDEFNDWFSKEIESSAESKKVVSKAHLQRLHLILQPFMLRREKKDVKDELGIKTEKDVFCRLSYRQRLLYYGIEDSFKSKGVLSKVYSKGVLEGKYNTECIDNIEGGVSDKGSELDSVKGVSIVDSCLTGVSDKEYKLKGASDTAVMLEGVSNSIDKQDPLNKTTVIQHPPIVTPNIDASLFGLNTEYDNKDLDCLMNMAMQLRKVCNHPNLFEKPEVKSGFNFNKCCFIGRPYIDKGFSRIEMSLPKIVKEFIEEKKRRCYLQRERGCYLNSIFNLLDNTPDIRTDNITPDINIELFNNTACIKRFKSSLINKEEEMKYFCKNKGYFNIRWPMKITRDLYNSKYKEYNFIFPKVFNSNITTNINTVNTLTEQDLLKSISKGNRVLTHSTFNNTSLISLYNNTTFPTPFIYKEYVAVPKIDTFISDSGKLCVLDGMLGKLKDEGHRVLLYFQMTKMIDLMEEYLIKKGYSYLRLDGSCKIRDRRDMVREWQCKDIFIFLLSTRAGGLGINLTAADTVIFYDSDWNPTVDQQAMDRAHRLGQTKDVTVYRLITEGTIEERIMERAMKKGEIQRMVIQGGEFQGKYL